MRTGLIPVVLLMVAVPAAAQSRAPGATDDMPMPSIGLPLPHIGLPLPTLGLPLPQMGLPPQRSERSERIERSERSARSDGSERFARSGAIFLFIPTYSWPYYPASVVPALPSPPPQRATGRLHLHLRSGVDPQIFVDGYYMGLFSDVAGELTLEAGSHTLELREEGYDHLRVDVKIPFGDVITYDVNLKAINSTPLPVTMPPAPPIGLPPPSQAPPPTTIYMIPGCYVGNVPPQDAGLPAGCDATRAIAFPPRP